MFKDSRNFRLLDVDRKYNCVTEFRKIDFGLFRRNLNPRRFDEFTTRIAMLINKPTLVVCWKDINGGDDGPGKSEYAEQLSEALLLKGVPKELFTVTYYGSSDNKSTNNYRDIDQIVMCGDWTLPNIESARIRRAYGTTLMHRIRKTGSLVS